MKFSKLNLPTIPEALIMIAVSSLMVAIVYPVTQQERKNKKLIEESNQQISGEVIEEKYTTYIGEEEKIARSSGGGITMPMNMDTSKMGLAVVGGNTRYSAPAMKSQYLLKIKTDEGKTISLSVYDKLPSLLEDGKATKESLDMIVEVGSRISFPKGNFMITETDNGQHGYYRTLEEETIFNENTQVGTKRADRIRVLN